MGIETTAGAKVHIGPANGVAKDQAAYEALSYVEVGTVENIGEFGDASREVTFTDLSTRRVQKLKGSRDAGTLQLTFGNDFTNAGQTALKAAEKSDSDYAIKIEASDDGGTTPTTFYFRAKVMSFRFVPNDADSVWRLRTDLGINSEIVEVAAT